MYTSKREEEVKKRLHPTKLDRRQGKQSRRDGAAVTLKFSFALAFKFGPSPLLYFYLFSPRLLLYISLPGPATDSPTNFLSLPWSKESRQQPLQLLPSTGLGCQIFFWQPARLQFSPARRSTRAVKDTYHTLAPSPWQILVVER